MSVRAAWLLIASAVGAGYLAGRIAWWYALDWLP